MSDLNLEGLSQINDSVNSLNNSISKASTGMSETFIEGLHSIKESTLKVAVNSLPKEFLEVAKNVEILTTVTQQINKLSSSPKEKDKPDKDEEKQISPKGWTTDKLASSVPANIAAPALTIIQSLNDLFGERGTFLEALSGILNKNVLTKPLTSTEKLGKEQDIEGFKGPDSKNIQKYTVGIQQLDKLFGNILKVFFRGQNPRFTDKQIEQIEKSSRVFVSLGISMNALTITSKHIIFTGMLSKVAQVFLPTVKTFMLNIGEFVTEISDLNINEEAVNSIAKISVNLETIFKSIFQAEKYAIIAGLLAPVAAIVTPLMTLFVLSTGVLLKAFNLIDEEKVKSFSKSAKNLETIYTSLFEAEKYAILTGLMAIPAAILSAPIFLFVMSTTLISKALERLNTKELIQSELKTRLIKPIFQNLFFASLFAIGAGILAIPASITMPFLILFALETSILMKVLSKIDTKTLIGTQFKLLLIGGIMLTSLVSENLAIQAGEKAVPALLGLLGIGAFFIGIFVLGLLAKIALTGILALTLSSILITGSMFFFHKALLKTLEIRTLIEENFKNEKVPSTGTIFDGMLGVVGGLIPLAMVMAGFFVLGVISLFTIIPMAGLLIFSFLAIKSLPMFQMAIISLFDTVNLVGDLLSNIDTGSSILNAIGNFFPSIKPVIGLFAVVGSIFSLITIIGAMAILGTVAFLASAPLKGLEIFSSIVPNSLGGLKTAIPLIGEVVSSANNIWSSLASDSEEKGWLRKGLDFIGLGGVGDTVAVMGKFAQVIALITGLATIGMVASKTSSNLESLQKIGQSISIGLPGLVKGIESMPALNNVLSRIDINEFNEKVEKLGPVLGSLGKVNKAVSDSVDLAALSDTTKIFKDSLIKNILEPILKLDPAIQKLNELKNAAAGLNSELKKLTTENSSALTSISDDPLGGKKTAAMKLSPGKQSTEAQYQQNTEKEQQLRLLEDMADNVKIIANNTREKESNSWWG